MKQLVDEVLDTLPKPHTERVIEDVFAAIEQNAAWLKTYESIAYELGKPAANAWAGFWIAHAEGRIGDERETATRATLIESYYKLSNPMPKRNKKMKEPEALKAMHEHFQANRAALPPTVRDYRDVIVTLIMSGIAPDVAFAKALEKPMYAW